MRRAGISLILIAVTLIASDNALSEQSAGAPDRLCGWYKLTTDNRLIPVFKIEGTYYTVMSRGVSAIQLVSISENQWFIYSALPGLSVSVDSNCPYEPGKRIDSRRPRYL